jgi:hypothetical protein
VLTQTGWYTRVRVLDREWKEQSIMLAHSCREEAVARVISDLHYVGAETILIRNGSCYVYPVKRNVPAPGLLSLRVKATVQTIETTLVATYAMHDIHLNETPDTMPKAGSKNFTVTTVSWYEVP